MDAVEKQENIKVPIFHNRNFVFLLISALFSSPGYYVYLIGAEWLMLSITDNRFYFGLLFFVAAIPRLILLIVGGIIADRVNKRTILFWSDFSRAVLIGILVVLIITDQVAIWHLLALSGLFGISDAFSYPAMNSLIPNLLEDDQLQRGNSFIQMTNQISPILGPALGGTLIALLGFEGVFSVAFVMLLLSAIAVLFIRLKHLETDEDEKHTPLADLKEGFQYARKKELIISVVVMALFLNLFFSGPIAIGMPVIVKDVFNGSAVSLATIQTSMGIGALAGAILLASWKLKSPGKTVILGLIGLGLAFSTMGLSSNIWMMAGLVALMSVLTQVVNIPLITMLQQTTEKRMLGRMMSMFMTVSTGLTPISYIVTSSLIAAGISIRVIIVVSGVVVTAIAIYSFRNKKLLGFKLSQGRESL
ncbi:MFS transporter [Ornithinibacillus scapharcae]|uniref:MFS transporter n=1 Tax=Ornithinibacillus scapharcae TaxID=1147159 RepID=UPI000225B7A0|nr:MFS transporter [Ornithinibacillus scapharcae]